MKLTLILISICIVHVLHGQSHAEVVAKINSIEEATKFASNHRDVTVDFVDAENDVFLFDKIDTSKMESYVGKVETVYRRSTKFLKDTIIQIANVQFIRFKPELITLEESVDFAQKIMEDHNGGMSYWNIMKKYQREGIVFNGGPKTDLELLTEFNSNFNTRSLDEMFITNTVENESYPVVALIRVKSHDVPAFIAISYNEMGGRYSGHFIND